MSSKDVLRCALVAGCLYVRSTLGGMPDLYNYDVPVMEPAAVIQLVPLPAFLVYQ